MVGQEIWNDQLTIYTFTESLFPEGGFENVNPQIRNLGPQRWREPQQGVENFPSSVLVWLACQVILTVKWERAHGWQRKRNIVKRQLFSCVFTASFDWGTLPWSREANYPSLFWIWKLRLREVDPSDGDTSHLTKPYLLSPGTLSRRWAGRGSRDTSSEDKVSTPHVWHLPVSGSANITFSLFLGPYLTLFILPLFPRASTATLCLSLL